MSEFNITNNQVIFTNINETKQVILDTSNFLKNKSRVPMHSIEKDNSTILSFISNLIQKNETIMPHLALIKKIQYITLDTLLIAELIKSSAPVKIAEFGCTNGELSYNLTEVARKFNPNSLLCLISNVIGNNSNNKCLDFITKAEALPELSMVYSDYAKTNLADNSFDFVIINGDVICENFYDIIKEAERITKNNGIIFCYSNSNYLLTSTFQLIFSERKEYQFTNTDIIITARKTNDSWNHDTNDSLSNLSMLKDLIKEEIYHNNGINVYRTYIQQLNSYIDNAIATYDIKTKLELIQLKENLLDYINYLYTPHEEFYRNKLVCSL